MAEETVGDAPSGAAGSGDSESTADGAASGSKKPAKKAKKAAKKAKKPAKKAAKKAAASEDSSDDAAKAKPAKKAAKKAKKIMHLDDGDVAVPPGPAGDDFIFRAADGGTAVGIELRGSGTPGIRALDPFDWLAVTSATDSGLTSSTSVRFNPFTVYVVRSGGVHNLYKLGYPVRNSFNVTFVYAPLGAIPAGFMCAAP